jgi:hypothetical protein
MNPNHLLHNPLSFEPIAFFPRLPLGCILWDIDLGLYPSPFSHGYILQSHLGPIAHYQAKKRMSLRELFLPNSLCTFAMSFDIWRGYRRSCDEVTNFLVLILIALSA